MSASNRIKDNSEMSFNDYYEKLLSKWESEITTFSIDEYNHVCVQVIKRIIESAKNKKTPPHEFQKNHIHLALDLINDLKAAIYVEHTKNEDGRYTTIYDDNNWSEAYKPWIVTKTLTFTNKTGHRVTSPACEVNFQKLEHVIAKYLSYTWLSSPEIEWYLANAYLKNRLFVIGGKISLKQYSFLDSLAAEHSETEFGYFGTLILNRVAGFGLPIALLTYLIMNNYDLTATGTGFAIIAYYIKKIFSSRRIKKERSQHSKWFEKLYKLKDYISANSWSPTFLMETLKELNHEVIVAPSLMALTAKMMKRNPDILSYLKRK